MPDGTADARLLGDVAYNAVEDMIVTRRLPPGSMVSEVQLAAELGIGRTPLREALQRLRQIGFVEMHPRRGTLVANIDVSHQFDLLELRRPLEQLMARCAAERALPGERQQLVEIADRIQTTAADHDLAGFFEANKRIHELLAAATHNSLLEATIKPVHARSRQFWYHFVERDRAYGDSSRLHADVLRKIVARQADDAAQAADRLIDFLADLTRATLDRFR